MATTADLFQAIQSGDVERVRALLAATPSLAAARNEAGLSAVLAACYRHNRAVVDTLLAAQPDLDIFAAAAVDQPERVRALLAQDPDLATAHAPDGFTALQLACFFAAPNTARVLVEAGADLNAHARNPFNVAPLHAAAAGGDHAIIQLLLDRGANPNARQQSGFTPLQEAANRGDAAMLDLLLAAGADPALTNDEGQTAADIALVQGHAELAERLQAASAVNRP